MISHRNSFRMLAGAWFLATLVLVNSYAGLLSPFLTVRKMKPAINSFEDLVSEIKQPGITLAVNTDSFIGNIILVCILYLFKITIFKINFALEFFVGNIQEIGQSAAILSGW